MKQTIYLLSFFLLLCISILVPAGVFAATPYMYGSYGGSHWPYYPCNYAMMSSYYYGCYPYTYPYNNAYPYNYSYWYNYGYQYPYYYPTYSYGYCPNGYYYWNNLCYPNTYYNYGYPYYGGY